MALVTKPFPFLEDGLVCILTDDISHFVLTDGVLRQKTGSPPAKPKDFLRINSTGVRNGDSHSAGAKSAHHLSACAGVAVLNEHVGLLVTDHGSV